MDIKFQFFAFLIFIISCNSSTKENAFGRFISRNPDTKPLSPAESIKKIQLPPGYKIELIAAEPLIQDPVGMAWDANGDMYVVQMNTFMLDAHGTNQSKPYSQIKKLRDTNEDGIMDVATIFVDSLLLPRVVLPVGDELFVQLTDTQHIYAYKDTNNDGIADVKRIAFHNYTIDHRNMEHQNGGLVWNLDNWIYPSRDNLRYKYENGNLKADTMNDYMIGQWGMTADDQGRLYYSEAGPGLPAVQFEQMPKYGSLNFADQYDDDFSIPYPVIGNVDAQGGEYAIDSINKTLMRFTSGCGQSIYRGDQFPADVVGDYFIAEPVARIIKRGKIEVKNGKRIIHNAYEQKDWLASSDFNFRPVNTYTGPDGCFYIVDMYRGIIQEGEFAQDDSYLSKKISEFRLDSIKGKGRIYRVYHQDFSPINKRPQLLSKSNKELVGLLGHSNGWWRDMAQQLLIFRNARDIIPDLKKNISIRSTSGLLRIHSIWTLEGLNALSELDVLTGLNDPLEMVRKTTVWASEKFIGANSKSIISALKKMFDDESTDVKTQLYLSFRTYGGRDNESFVDSIVRANPDMETIQYSHKVYLENKSKLEKDSKSIAAFSAEDNASIARGNTTFRTFCASCHGQDGKGIQMGNAPLQAPPLAGSPRVQGDKIMLIQILLYGLSGALDGHHYPGPMIPQKHNSDQWIADVLSFIRSNQTMNHHAPLISATEVEDIRLTSPNPESPPDLRTFEIYKLGRSEAQNWAGGKPGSNGNKWGGRFLNRQERDSIKNTLK